MKDGSHSTWCLKFPVFGVSTLVQADMSHGSRSNFCVNEANVQVFFGSDRYITALRFFLVISI